MASAIGCSTDNPFFNVAPTLALAVGSHDRAATRSLHSLASRAGTSSSSLLRRLEQTIYLRLCQKIFTALVGVRCMASRAPGRGTLPISLFGPRSFAPKISSIHAGSVYHTHPRRRLLCKVRTAGLGRLSLPTDVRAAPVVTQIGHWIGRTQFIDHARSR